VWIVFLSYTLIKSMLKHWQSFVIRILFTWIIRGMPPKKKSTPKSKKPAAKKVVKKKVVKPRAKKRPTSAEGKNVLDRILGNSAGEHNFFAEPQVHFEGQLAIDMGETKDDLVIVSTIAGASPEDISINIDGDTLTIRGQRDSTFEGSEHDYFYKECYWGWFSRSIVLPVDVKKDEAQADFHNGLLTITVPKAKTTKSVPIHIVEE